MLVGETSPIGRKLRRWGLAHSLLAVFLCIVGASIATAQPVPSVTGKFRLIAPSSNTPPAPLGAIAGEWELEFQEDGPTLVFDLVWHADGTFQLEGESYIACMNKALPVTVGVTCSSAAAEAGAPIVARWNIVSVVQTPAHYLTFFRLPLPDRMNAGAPVEMRVTLPWGAFLELDLVSQSGESFLTADAMRDAWESGVDISSLLLVKADFEID